MQVSYLLHERKFGGKRSIREMSGGLPDESISYPGQGSTLPVVFLLRYFFSCDKIGKVSISGKTEGVK